MNRLLAAILAQLPGARRDNELLDRLGSATPGVDPIGTPSVPMTELDAVLISHRLVVEADPIPDLVDTDTAIATIKAGAL